MDLAIRHCVTRDLNNELVEAAANGDLDNVQRFLQNGANPNYIIRVEDPLNIEDLVYRSTALMKAAHNGHLQTVITLLRHVKNSDDMKFSTYWTVLVATLRNNAFKRQSLALYFNSEGTLSLEELQDLNEFSLVSKHFQILIYLIEEGVDINTVLRNGMTPLMIAARSGSTTSMQYLIDHGADVNLLLYSNDKVMYSALICAVREIQEEATTLLLKHGVEMDSLQVQLAFFIAISSGNMTLIKLLVSYGARPVMVQTYDLYKMDIIELNDISMYNDKVSPLYVALYSNQPQVAWHFLSIGFLTDFDVKFLSNQNDLRCRLEADENYSRVLEILNHINHEPMPLVLVCFVGILERLSQNTMNKELLECVDSLRIPKGMKSRLMFGRTYCKDHS